MFQIIRKESLAPSIKLLEIKAPRIARKAEAGQFLIVRLGEKGERIPLTIADTDPQKETVTIVFLEIGKTTEYLGKLAEGEIIQDVAGPLGNPTEVKNFGRVVCVAGGVGVACIYPVCKALKSAGNEVVAIIGARNKDLLFWEEKLSASVDELYLATDDGSYGQKGFVTDVLSKYLQDENSVDRLITVGPLPMMRAVAELTKKHSIKTIVSLNPIMVDGIGMCGACRVTVGGCTKMACVAGPEFDGHQVDFAELSERLQRYREEEKLSLVRFKAGCDCSEQRA